MHRFNYQYESLLISDPKNMFDHSCDVSMCR